MSETVFVDASAWVAITNPDPTKTDHPVGRQGYTWHGSQPNGWWFLNFTQGEFLIHGTHGRSL